MNLSEFKAWFEGFTENLDGPPGQKAWDKICARVKTIKSDPTPWPVFIDRHVPSYPRPYWEPYFQTWMRGAVQDSQKIADYSGGYSALNALPQNGSKATPASAFAALGRLDALSMNDSAD